jgi:hypothetical protein
MMNVERDNQQNLTAMNEAVPQLIPLNFFGVARIRLPDEQQETRKYSAGFSGMIF